MLWLLPVVHPLEEFHRPTKTGYGRFTSPISAAFGFGVLGGLNSAMHTGVPSNHKSNRTIIAHKNGARWAHRKCPVQTTREPQLVTSRWHIVFRRVTENVNVGFFLWEFPRYQRNRHGFWRDAGTKLTRESIVLVWHSNGAFDTYGHCSWHW